MRLLVPANESSRDEERGLAFGVRQSVHGEWERETALDETVSAQLEELQGRSTEELQARYREVFGMRSLSSHRTHLLRRLAWRLQAECEGAPSERLLRRW